MKQSPGEPTRDERLQLHRAQELEKFRASEGYDQLKEVVSARVARIFIEFMEAESHEAALIAIQGKLKGLLEPFKAIGEEIDGASLVRSRIAAEIEAARTQAVREAGNSFVPRRNRGGAL